MVLVWCVAFSLYAYTMHFFLGDADSAEYVFKSRVLVSAHPPGYPLLLLLGKVTEYMSWIALKAAEELSQTPTPQWTLVAAHNALAVFLSSLAVAFLFSTNRKLGSGVGASAAGAFLFGFAPFVRTFATQIEVFPLNHFLLSLFLWTAATFASAPEAQRPRWLRLGCFLCGLLMCNQHTAVFCMVPAMVWVLCTWPKAFRYTRSCVAALVLGLAPYAVLPLSMYWSREWLFLSWGRFNNLNDVLHVFLRRDYGTLSLVGSSHAATNYSAHLNWEAYMDTVKLQTLSCLWVVGLFGAAASLTAGARKRDTVVSKKASGAETIVVAPPLNSTRSLWWAIVVMLVSNVCAINCLSNLDISPTAQAENANLSVLRRMWFQPLLLLSMCVACGITKGISLILPSSKSGTTRRVCDVVIGVALIILQEGLHWENNNTASVQSEFSAMIVRSLPPRAVLVVDGDAPYLGSCAVAYGLQERLDVIIVQASFLFSDFFAENLLRSTEIQLPGRSYDPYLVDTNGTYNNKMLLDTLIGTYRRRVFYIGKFTAEVDLSHGNDYSVRYLGLLNEFVTAQEFETMGSAVFQESHPNSEIDWRGSKSRHLQPYVSQLYSALPLTIPDSFSRTTYTTTSFEADVLRNFKSSMTTNAEQLLVFAAYDDARQLDVQLPLDIADLVASNQTSSLIMDSSSHSQIPHRYRMLVLARTLLQHNRRILRQLVEPQAPLSVDELIMFRVLQQLMRFHVCSEQGLVHQALFDEMAAVASSLLTAAKEMNLQDTEEFSRQEVLDYMVWVKRYRTRRHNVCRT